MSQVPIDLSPPPPHARLGGEIAQLIPFLDNYPAKPGIQGQFETTV